MQEFGERCEVFYDSLDCLPSLDGESGIGLWRYELGSVKERRDAFLCKMGFIESCKDESLGLLELDRVSESGGAASSYRDSSSTGNGTVENASSGDRDAFGEGNELADDPEIDLSIGSSGEIGVDHSVLVSSEAEESDEKHGFDKKVTRHWWKKLMSLGRKPEISRTVKVQANKKRFKELSALYPGQEFRAHKGVVWTAKFSPNGHYLATGGQDGVLRVWCVTSTDSLEKRFVDQEGINGDKTGLGRQKSVLPVPVFVPDRVFQIKETPVHEFHGHDGDILDLDWSNSNMILSSSTDSSVRLWQVGSDECLGVFQHPDFVTCAQFNPINDGCFVSGSIDGKIRVWGVSEGRVIEWDNAREAVTAVSYQPDGQGLVAGLVNGTCRLYEASGSSLQLSEHVQILGCRRSSGSRITGIQFCPENPERVMVTSEDSKIRVFDKTNIIKKYRGLPKSGTQTSASFTPSGRHVVSIGEDSHVYLWDYNSQDSTPPSKHTKSIRSCEYFHSQGVSVALPWGGQESAHTVISGSCSQAQGPQESECVSLAKWFSIDGSSRVTATWPEEMLHSRDVRHQSPTWGLVIVTASCDGMIRVFHNYGLLSMRV